MAAPDCFKTSPDNVEGWCLDYFPETRKFPLRKCQECAHRLSLAERVKRNKQAQEQTE